MNILRFVNKLLPVKYQNERGVWWAIPAAIGALATGAGMSAYSNSKKKTENQITQLPEYPESEGARQLWWEKLQAWGSDPNYGAVTPDWDNIWNLTQRKIKEYYSGNALTTGARDRLKANLARRNMEESPASDYLLTGMDVEQGKQLEEAAVQEGIQKTDLAESGRQNWLASMQNLSNMKPSFVQSQTTTGGIPWMDIMGSTLTAGATAGMQYESSLNQQKLLEKYLDKSMPQTTPSSITGTMGKSDSLYDKLNSWQWN